ncbi:MAG: DUF454 family protein [Bacteroidales bacterium]|nr:DUF454 family protein [Bacteroidales bacterium]
MSCAWFHRNRIIRPFLKAYIEGAGLSRRRKTGTIMFLWVTLLISAWFVRGIWWVLIILGSVGIEVTWHVATLKSKMKTVE